jgi:hypothetical protein
VGYDNSVGTETRLRAARLRNRGSTPDENVVHISLKCNKKEML